jgi:superfamily I DNA/RNA helicase
MKLTEEQNAAVQAEGRIQVLSAGAGSGKTRTLVAKVARDQARGISPSIQVVVTFTNAAANEVRRRIEESGSEPPAFVGTLHAFCLRQIGPSIGSPRMIGDKEFEKLILDVLESSGIKGVSLRKAKEFAGGDGFGLVGKNRSARAAIVGQMGRLNLIHPDMILGIFKKTIHSLDLPDHLHLYVDEFQDTAAIDAAIYRAFVEDLVATLFVVGDPRQAIFAFRGATSAEFLKLWDVAEWRGELTTNFRSRGSIIAESNHIANRMTLPPNLSPVMTGDRDFGDTPERREFATCEEEAEAIATVLRSIARGPEGPSALEDFAVLARYNASVELIGDVLRGHGIEVNSSLDRTAAVAFLDEDPTVKKLLALQSIPPAISPSWEALLVKFDAPRKTRELLLPLLREVSQIEDLPFALKEGFLKPRANAVTVSTIHAAKGLEWPEVWIAGADSKSFDESDSEDVRLAYVAATRPQDALTVSFARSRVSFRREVDLTPSPVLFSFQKSCPKN